MSTNKDVILYPVSNKSTEDDIRVVVDVGGRSVSLSLRDLRSLGVEEDRIQEILDNHYL